MRKIFILLFTAALFHLSTSAQTNDLINYIPANSSIVIDIDCGSFSQKISMQDLVGLKFFDSLVKKIKAESKEKFANPSESGIDYHDHLYMTIAAKNDEPEGYITIYGKVNDEAKLGQLLERSEDKKVTRKTFGKNKMILKENYLFAWNNFMFVVYAKSNKKKEVSPKPTETQKKKQLADLEKKGIELLTPKTQSILSNKHFESLAQVKGDLKVWIDNNSIIQNKGNNPFTALKLGNPLQADHKAIVVNFDKGKILSNTYTYYNDSMLPLAQNLYAEKVNAELIRKIPAGNILGLYAVSFNPDGIKDFFENTGVMKAFEDTDTTKEAVKAKDALKAVLNNLKGDLVVAAALPDQIQEGDPESKNPFSSFNIYMAATVNDEAKMNKLIDSIKALEKQKKKEIDTLEDGQIVKNSNFFKGLKSSIKVENGAVFFTAGNLANTSLVSTNNYDALIEQYGQRPIMMMFDMKTMMSMLAGAMNKERHDPESDNSMFAMFEVFDKMITSGGKFENGVMITTQEVKFTNPEESSLKQMMKMFDLAISAFSKFPSKKTVKDVEIKEN